MIYEIVRPENLPAQLLSFEFYFENVNTRIVNLYHAAGMSLVYYVEKICYVLPQNEFYELLRLDNLEEPHDKKYNWLIMKGSYQSPPQIKTSLIIDYPEEMEIQRRGISLNEITVGKLPEQGNEIALQPVGNNLYYRFLCENILEHPLNHLPMLVAKFNGSYESWKNIISLWCNNETCLRPFS